MIARVAWSTRLHLVLAAYKPMARVNNELSYGDHTREQLVNWLMGKNSVATCFIKDVLSMSESEGRGGTHFRLSTRIATHIRLDKRQAFHIISSDVYRADQSP